MNTEAIVYLARKLHWTRDEIGELTLQQFYEVLKELQYQESLETYREQHNIASLLAAIYNTIPRKRGSKTFKASDFLRSDIPERHEPKDSLEEMADKRGVKLPIKELKER